MLPKLEIMGSILKMPKSYLETRKNKLSDLDVVSSSSCHKSGDGASWEGIPCLAMKVSRACGSVARTGTAETGGHRFGVGGATRETRLPLGFVLVWRQTQGQPVLMGVPMDGKPDVSQQCALAGRQPDPGLHPKKRGQQGEGGDLCSVL